MFEAKYQARLYLIRYGRIALEVLHLRLDQRSKNVAFRLVNKLIDLGLLIIPVQRRPDGDIELCRYPQTSLMLADQPKKTNDVDEHGGARC